MTSDPIVEGVREARRKILDECAGNLDRLLDRYERSQSEVVDRVVTREDVRTRSRRPPPVTPGPGERGAHP